MSITVVINSHENQSAIPKVIRNLNKCPLVTEIIIWDNSPNSQLTLNDNTHNKVKIINSSTDMGLSTKWTMGLFAKNDCVITQDDNDIVPEQCIGAIYNRWKKEPEIMHGTIGYTFANQEDVPLAIKNGDAQVVVTGFTALHRSWCARYLESLEVFKESYGDKQFNSVSKKGCDIFMSYLIMSTNKKMNLIHGDIGIGKAKKSLDAPSRRVPRFDAHEIKLIKNIREHLSV